MAPTLAWGQDLQLQTCLLSLREHLPAAAVWDDDWGDSKVWVSFWHRQVTLPYPHVTLGWEGKEKT